MARERLTPDSTSSLTPEEIAAAVQAESLRAARTGLNNALTNAGMLTSDQAALERARESGKFQQAPTAPATPVAPTVDPLKNKAVQPTAPDGYEYIWIGGSTTGSWKLYKKSPTGVTGGTGGGGTGGTGGTGTTGGTTGTTGQIYTASDGKTFTDQQAYVAYETSLRNAGLQTAYQAAQNKAARQSAYDLLYQQFKQYGLESLVEPLKGLIQKDISPSQFTIELRNTPQYKTRFAANEQRIKAGFKALDEGTYLALEDAYQKLMMNYGLPNSYWEKGEMGVQPGFEKLIAGNVDPIELENRLQLAVDQIEKGPKEYMDAIKQFYPDINRGDLMAYVLDPANALKAIQSKVKAAQVGGEYLRSGIATNVARSEELARQGVTAEMARANIPTIMDVAKRGGELAGFYQSAGLGPYDQATAEEEIYNLGRAAEARKKRQQLTSLEQSAFSGSSGVSSINRDRAGAI